MTGKEAKRIRRWMLLVIPGMILAIIGDYCMGIEPADSVPISGMISSGWLTISDLRITVSNIGGMIGTALYTVAALAFIRYLQYKLMQCNDKKGKLYLITYIAGLIWGIMVFMYFHLACGTLIHNFSVIYDATGGNTDLAVEMWNRTYSVQFVTYWVSFIVLGIASTGGWIAIISGGVLPLKKIWVLAAPLVIACIGFLLEWLLPLPISGLSSGFESFGWIVMFLGGREAIRNEVMAV
ncbi:MAG: hypothetical protein IJ744_07200 [Lachnospiraceae bacterium]|nr:hypothetical protein [Lachnospiraceae bacterium]